MTNFDPPFISNFVPMRLFILMHDSLYIDHFTELFETREIILSVLFIREAARLLLVFLELTSCTPSYSANSYIFHGRFDPRTKTHNLENFVSLRGGLIIGVLPCVNSAQFERRREGECAEHRQLTGPE